MFEILKITLPIYIIIACGYFATRYEIFIKSDMRVLGKFVINIALPCMIFNAISSSNLDAIINSSYLLSYVSGSFLAAGAGIYLSRKFNKAAPTESVYYGIGVSMSNSAFVGYPILLLALPEVAGIALSLNLVVENLIMFPIMLALAERGQDNGMSWHRMVIESIKRVLKNPLIIAQIAGVLALIFGLTLPSPAARTLTLFAQSSSALSLFVIGGTLFGLSTHGMLRQISPIILGKLLFHPLAVGFFLWFYFMLGLPAMAPALVVAAILSAAMPMIGIYAILAQRHGYEDFSAAALLGATIGSFFTISTLIWLSKQFLN